MYASDKFNSAIRTIDLASALVGTLAGRGSTGGGTCASGFADGVGTNALFNYPSGLVLYAGDTLFVGDYYSSGIRQIDVVSGTVTTPIGRFSGQGHVNGIGTTATFVVVSCLALDSGNSILYAVDQMLIRAIALPSLTVTSVVGGGSDSSSYGNAPGIGTAALFQDISGLAVDAAGANLYLLDSNQVKTVVLATLSVLALAGSPTGVYGSADGMGTAARFYNPAASVVSGGGEALLVLDGVYGTVRSLTLATGAVSTIFMNAYSSRSVSQPGAIKLSVDGATAYIGDRGRTIGLALYDAVSECVREHQRHRLAVEDG